jgi:hypothetical protein
MSQAIKTSLGINEISTKFSRITTCHLSRGREFESPQVHELIPLSYRFTLFFLLHFLGANSGREGSGRLKAGVLAARREPKTDRFGKHYGVTHDAYELCLLATWTGAFLTSDFVVSQPHAFGGVK